MAAVQRLASPLPGHCSSWIQQMGFALGLPCDHMSSARSRGVHEYDARMTVKKTKRVTWSNDSLVDRHINTAIFKEVTRCYSNDTLRTEASGPDSKFFSTSSNHKHRPTYTGAVLIISVFYWRIPTQKALIINILLRLRMSAYAYVLVNTTCCLPLVRHRT